MYTQRAPGIVGNNSATLMTNLAQPVMTGPKCLTFWYHMFGRDRVNFSLMVNTVNSPLTGQPKMLWVKRQPQSNYWVQAQVNILVQMLPYYLMFTASLLATSRDVIGLDDITYTDGECPENLFCDFEVSPIKSYQITMIILIQLITG